jgi:anthranilate phosphoribosyltransferase
VHGEPGLDELSPIGTTQIVEVNGAALTRRTFDPAELGWQGFTARGLEGGDPQDNVRTVVSVLRGELGGVARAAVVLNAGAAIYVAGQAPPSKPASPPPTPRWTPAAAGKPSSAYRDASRR